MTRWRLKSREELYDLASLENELLDARGVDGENKESFFAPKYDRDIHDPFLLHGMEGARDLIKEKIDSQQAILIYGDYDADGITSTAILVKTIEQLGGEATPYLPHRNDDGYGLNREVLEKFMEMGLGLVVTVDCGVSNYEEIKWLKDKGVPTIVVDHHEIPEKLPPAEAVIHPRHPEGEYPYEWLCGAGVAWKVAQVLLSDKDADAPKWLMDLAAIGTIADRMPLTGENRAIVQFGLTVWERSRRLGLRLMAAETGAKSAIDIAFQVVPPLNAAGRLDHAQPAFELVSSEDTNVAQAALKKVLSLNRKRQTLTRKIVAEAEGMIETTAVAFAYNESWQPGLVGLAAGKIAEAKAVPAVVIGHNGKHAVGSARAPEGMNILETLRGAEKLMLKLGGHAAAAGFSVEVEKVEDLKRELSNAKWEVDDGEKLEEAEAVLGGELVNMETLRMVEKFAPFGEGNPAPKFVFKNVELVEAKPVGGDRTHLKCAFLINGQRVGGIGFGLAYKMEGLVQQVDVLGSLSENEWQGRKSLQIEIEDIVAAGEGVIG